MTCYALWYCGQTASDTVHTVACSNRRVPTKKCGCQERGPHTYTVTPRRVRATTVFVQKQDVLHILRVCLWRQSPNMHSACAFRHLWPARLHHIFPHYLINGTIFGKKKKKVHEYKKCVLIFSTTSVRNISHPKKNVIRIQVKYPYSCHTLMKLEFSRQIFRKNTQISNVTKIRPMGAKLFHAYGQRDLIKLTIALCNFEDVLNNAHYTTVAEQLWEPLGSGTRSVNICCRTANRYCRTVNRWCTANIWVVPLTYDVVPLTDAVVPLTDYVPLTYDVSLTDAARPLTDDVPLTHDVIPLTDGAVQLTDDVPLTYDVIPLTDYVPLTYDVVPLTDAAVPLTYVVVPLKNIECSIINDLQNLWRWADTGGIT